MGDYCHHNLKNTYGNQAINFQKKSYMSFFSNGTAKIFHKNLKTPHNKIKITESISKKNPDPLTTNH